MKRDKHIEVEASLWNEDREVIPLIDLFVDMCFAHMNNAFCITQFKLVSAQMGYPIDMIEQVVEMGKSEYEKMLSEINEKEFDLTR